MPMNLSKAGPFLIFLGTLVSGITLSSHCGLAAERNCDGFMVSDTVQVVEPSFQKFLDSPTFDFNMGFTFSFWDPRKSPAQPDTCLNGKCTASDSLVRTNYWTNWSQRVFTDFIIFSVSDSITRVNPGDFEVSQAYHHFYANKSTILALSKECYIESIDGVGGGPDSRIQSYNPKAVHLQKSNSFNAKGAQLDPSQKPGLSREFSPKNP